jgi:hypothetical protein
MFIAAVVTAETFLANAVFDDCPQTPPGSRLIANQDANTLRVRPAVSVASAALNSRHVRALRFDTSTVPGPRRSARRLRQ